MIKYFWKVLVTTVVCGLVLFFVVLVVLMTCHQCMEGRAYPVKSVVPFMRTGDLLVFDNESLPTRMVKTFSGGTFGHVGVVLVDSEGVFVLEAGVYPQTPYKGVYKIPLEEWLSINQGNRLGWVPLKEEIKVNVEGVLQRFKELEGRRFDGEMVGWYHTLGPFRKEGALESPRERVFCAETAAHLLQAGGVLPRDYTPDSYSPYAISVGSGKFSEVIPVFQNGS